MVIKGTEKTKPRRKPARFVTERDLSQRAQPDLAIGALNLPRNSALAGLITRVGLVNEIDPALAANEAAILVARLRCLERINDFHGPVLEFTNAGGT